MNYFDNGIEVISFNWKNFTYFRVFNRLLTFEIKYDSCMRTCITNIDNSF